ncbi:MAG TPA: hypothetical protein VKR06_45225 [Ktedonosporobacter sp.]|nr:hypothetical protein [Ktedonosporobacter sp.]
MTSHIQHSRVPPIPQSEEVCQQPEEPPVYLILVSLTQFARYYSHLQQRYGKDEAARMLQDARMMANSKGAQ